MKKRHPLIFYGLTIAIVTLILERAVLLVVVANFGPVFLLLLPLIIMEMCRWTIVCLVLTKLWLLWFTIKWSMASIDNWQHIINHESSGQPIKCINWFLSSRRQYGNFSRMLRVFGCWSTACFVLCSAEWVHIVVDESNHDNLVDTAGIKLNNFAVLVTFIPSVLAAILLLKLSGSPFPMSPFYELVGGVHGSDNNAFGHLQCVMVEMSFDGIFQGDSAF